MAPRYFKNFWRHSASTIALAVSLRSADQADAYELFVILFRYFL